MGKKVFFVAVNDMDGMVGRFAKRKDDGDKKPKKIPFETEHETLASLEAALKRGPVLGSQLIYERIPDSWQRRITRRIEMRLTHDNCGSIIESRIEFLEPASR